MRSNGVNVTAESGFLVSLSPSRRTEGRLGIPPFIPKTRPAPMTTKRCAGSPVLALRAAGTHEGGGVR